MKEDVISELKNNLNAKIKAPLIKNWKYLFTEKTLDKGYSYYKEGRVVDLNYDDNYIRATCIGNEDYAVRIKYVKENVISMKCDCPIGVRTNCKHMAAVLYQLEKEGTPVSNFTGSDLATYLIAALNEDSDFYNKYILDYLNHYNKEDKFHMIEEILDIVCYVNQYDKIKRKNFVLLLIDQLKDYEKEKVYYLLKETYQKAFNEGFQDELLTLINLIDDETIKEDKKMFNKDIEVINSYLERGIL